MSKTKNKRKSPQNSTTEFLESPERLADSLMDTDKLLKKYQYPLIGAVVLILLIIGGVYYYQTSSARAEANAQADLYPSVYYLGMDSLNMALNGSSAYPGFLEITEDYSSSNAGELAHFYAGIAFLKQGKFQEAIEELESFNPGDIILQARAYSLIGDAYLELKDYPSAIEYYKKAIAYKPNQQFTPAYLMKLALAYELSKSYQEAVDTYERILTDYPTSAVLLDAKKYKARAEIWVETPPVAAPAE